ncbi:MAG TPA: hypothetical protein VK629_12000 [Steroidobacteraceae bacterium]|nr:hypothetical protein [Steroidobacteraceae bacterium]
MQPAHTEGDQKLVDLKELGALLLKHFEIKEGLWDVAVEFQFAIGAIGPKPDTVLPGAMFGVNRVGLRRTPVRGPLTIDADASDDT